MDGNAAALPRRQLLTPIAVGGDKVDDTTQAAGVDQVLIGDPGSELIDAVIRIVDDDAQRLQVKRTRRPEQLAQVVDWVLSRGGRQLVDKPADSEGVRARVDPALPADAP